MRYEERACETCPRTFLPRVTSQRRCPECSRKRRGRDRSNNVPTPNLNRRDHFLVFTAVDGEGVTDPVTGEHAYVMLTVGTRTLVRADRGRLTFLDVFRFLWEHFEENPQNVYVGFYLGYDFTQWLRTLPEPVARDLITDEGIKRRKRKLADGTNLPPSPVRIGPWEIDTLGSKRLKLRKRGDTRWMYINDVGPFFQSSFLTAIDPKSWPTPIVSDEEYRIIVEGKEERSTAVLDERMELYNKTENIALERLMGKLNAGLTAAGIRLDRDAWYGPGQAAQFKLNAMHAPTRQELEDATPSEILEAAQRTYYGGWFEIFAHGHVPGMSYEYDINSAYPWAISRLPDFRFGRWYPCRDLRAGGLDSDMRAPTLLLVTARGTNSNCGALPYRDRNGRIFRPREVKGWYWAHEIEAAIRAGVISTVDIHDGWRFEPDDVDAHPFAWVADAYLERLNIGKNTPQGKAIKLWLNSLYGKMAQSIGSPRYASALHASLITSECRRMILDAIATHPRRTDALLMVATDGVYFDSPNPSLDCSADRLGAWDETVRKNLTLLMPGVYWDDDTRERLARNAGIKLKSRGVSAAALASQLAECDEQWSRVRDSGPANIDWPVINVPLRFEMVTIKQALVRGDWQSAGTVRTPDHPGATPLVKTLSADPEAKRSWPYLLYTPPGGQARLVSTSYGKGETLETTPYSERFGRELALTRDDQPIDAEGLPAEAVMRELMKEG